MSTPKGNHPAQRRYPPEIKERAVRMVQELRREDPADAAVLSRVARQLDVGLESLRTWVRQAEVDGGARPGLTSTEQAELAELRREIKELRQANEMADSTSQRNEPCEMSESQSRENVNARTTWTPVDRAKADGVPVIRPWLAVDRYRQGDRLHRTDGGQDGARAQARRWPSFRLGASNWVPEHSRT
jgi:transposase